MEERGGRDGSKQRRNKSLAPALYTTHHSAVCWSPVRQSSIVKASPTLSHSPAPAAAVTRRWKKRVAGPDGRTGGRAR